MPARKIARDYDFLNVNRIKGLADPVDARDAVNLQYLNNTLNSLPSQIELFAPVKYAFLYNINPSNDINTQVTGITLANGDRVALAGQTNPQQNGVYVVGSGGSLTRDTATANLNNRMFVITEGVAVDTNSVLLGNFLGHQSYTNNEYEVLVILPRNGVYGYTTTIGDGNSNTFAVNHNLGTNNVVVRAYEVSTGDEVELGVKVNGPDQITLEAYPAPGNNAIRVVVFGSVGIQ